MFNYQYIYTPIPPTLNKRGSHIPAYSGLCAPWHLRGTCASKQCTLSILCPILCILFEACYGTCGVVGWRACDVTVTLMHVIGARVLLTNRHRQPGRQIQRPVHATVHRACTMSCQLLNVMTSCRLTSVCSVTSTTYEICSPVHCRSTLHNIITAHAADCRCMTQTVYRYKD